MFKHKILQRDYILYYLECKFVTVNATGCGFDDYSRKYLIFSFLRTGVQTKS